MATSYTVVNGTKSTFSAMNGTVNVGALSYRNGVSYDTDAHVTADLATDGIAIIKDQTGVAFTEQTKRVIAIAAMYLNPLA